MGTGAAVKKMTFNTENKKHQHHIMLSDDGRLSFDVGDGGCVNPVASWDVVPDHVTKFNGDATLTPARTGGVVAAPSSVVQHALGTAVVLGVLAAVKHRQSPAAAAPSQPPKPEDPNAVTTPEQLRDLLPIRGSNGSGIEVTSIHTLPLIYPEYTTVDPLFRQQSAIACDV